MKKIFIALILLLSINTLPVHALRVPSAFQSKAEKTGIEKALYSLDNIETTQPIDFIKFMGRSHINVLDVGCADNGLFDFRLKQILNNNGVKSNITGIDLRLDDRHVKKGKHEGVRLEEVSVEDFATRKSEKGKYNVIVFNAPSLHFARDIESFLKILDYLLSEDGVVIFRPFMMEGGNRYKKLMESKINESSSDWVTKNMDYEMRNLPEGHSRLVPPLLIKRADSLRRYNIKHIYHGPETSTYKRFSARRYPFNRLKQQKNIELIFGIIPIKNNMTSKATIFNIGSGEGPLLSFGNYYVKNFDKDFPERWSASKIAEEAGAVFEEMEITDIQETCDAAIWYELPFFIRRYADKTKLWNSVKGTDKEKREKVFRESLGHTWRMVEEGGYFVITGSLFPNNKPADVYGTALELGFNVSEVHIIGKDIKSAKAIVLRKSLSGDQWRANRNKLKRLAYRVTRHSLGGISTGIMGYCGLLLNLAQIYDHDIYPQLKKEYESYKEANERSLNILTSGGYIDLQSELEFLLKKTEVLVNFFKLNFDHMSNIRDFASDDEKNIALYLSVISEQKDILARFNNLLFNCMDSGNVIEIIDFYINELRKETCVFINEKDNLNLNKDIRNEGLVIIGLIDNFYRNASNAKSSKPVITMRSSEENGYMKLEFSDTGKGIPADILDKIFNRGFTTRENGKGGLGLDITLEYIRAKHGKIQVDTKIDNDKANRLIFDENLEKSTIIDSNKAATGTTFTIWLPLFTEKPELKSRLKKLDNNTMLLRASMGLGKERMSKVEDVMDRKKKFTILLVENDPDETKEYREALEAKGYSVVTAESGMEAEEYLLDPDSELPSVVLTDYDMKPKGVIFARDVKNMGIDVTIMGHTKNHNAMWTICRDRGTGERIFQWMNKYNNEYLDAVDEVYVNSIDSEDPLENLRRLNKETIDIEMGDKKETFLVTEWKQAIDWIIMNSPEYTFYEKENLLNADNHKANLLFSNYELALFYRIYDSSQIVALREAVRRAILKQWRYKWEVLRDMGLCDIIIDFAMGSNPSSCIASDEVIAINKHSEQLQSLYDFTRLYGKDMGLSAERIDNVLSYEEGDINDIEGIQKILAGNNVRYRGQKTWLFNFIDESVKFNNVDAWVEKMSKVMNKGDYIIISGKYIRYKLADYFLDTDLYEDITDIFPDELKEKSDVKFLYENIKYQVIYPLSSIRVLRKKNSETKDMPLSSNLSRSSL